MEKTDNELIADFMGLELVVPKLIVYKPYYRDRNADGTLNRDYQFDKLLYDKSWDRLMPVVEKIEGLGYDVRILRHGSESEYTLVDITDHDNTEISCVSLTSKIQSVYQAVIEFIKWYNENKQP